MYLNMPKNIQKIVTELKGLNNLAKKILKIGSRIALGMFLTGAFLITINHFLLNDNDLISIISRTIVKDSFTILAEAVIGGLILDFLSKKN